MNARKQSKKKIVSLLIVLLSLFVWIVPPIALYEMSFNKHFPSPDIPKHADFLSQAKQEWALDKRHGMKNFYVWNEDGQRGTIVFAHGFGGYGFTAYAELLEFFTKQDFCVIAYNVNGHGQDNSSKAVGLPMGIWSLDFILNQTARSVKQPLYVFGHSWGAYSTANVVAKHDEIDGICVMSGFDESKDMLFASIEPLGKPFAYFWAPVASVWESIRVGLKTSWFQKSTSALDAFENAKANIVIVHGEQDAVVPIKYGYDKWFKKFGDDERFTFIRLQGRCHSDIYYNDKVLDEDLLINIIEMLENK